MEKESAITFPQGYQKFVSAESGGCKTSKKLKFWCLSLLVLNVLAAYVFVSLSYLKTEVDLLRQQVTLMEGSIQLKHEEIKYLKFLITGELNDVESAHNSNDASAVKEETNDENDEGDDTNYYQEDKNFNQEDDNDDAEAEDSSYLGFKRKREIRDNDSSFEKDLKTFIKNHTDDELSSSEKSAEEKASTERSSMEKSLESSSKEKLLPGSYRLSTRKSHVHRKHKKSRIGSAERFFTETHSTTYTPIQVRQSRTKPTQLHGIDKALWLQNQKFQQHTSAHRDTITKEEALLKGYNRRSEDASYEIETSKEYNPDALTYNMITIHFSADTSNYSRDRDPHYLGNGRMQIKSDVYKDWKPAHWTQGVRMPKYFHLHQGRVTVSTTGIYLIYAQIQYSNVQEVNGFSVFRNKEVVVQCITTSTHPDRHEIKSNTCGISTTILLQSNDSVCIKDLHHGRYVVLTPEKSYFGLVLLSPFKN